MYILTVLPEEGKIKLEYYPKLCLELVAHCHPDPISRKESWLVMRCCSHLWNAHIGTKVNKNELWMMRSNFAYVVPKLCQVHSNIQTKILPVSTSTQSRNCMSNVGRKHMKLWSCSFTHHPRCSKITHQGSRWCFRRTWVSHRSCVRFADPEALSQIPYSILKGAIHISMLMQQNGAQTTG